MATQMKCTPVEYSRFALLIHVNMDKLFGAVVCLSLCFVTGSELSCDAACECQIISPNAITVHCARQSLPRIPENIPSNVTYLDVSFNKIAALDGGNIKAFHRLKKLDLRNNLVARLDSWAFQSLVALEELDLDNNLLQTVTPFMFSAAANLKMLSLGNNVISRIDNAAFIHLTLDSLNLRGNVKLTSLENDIFRNSSIHTLILDGCAIDNIPRGLFGSLSSSLKVLSMSNMYNGLLLDSLSLSNLDLDILQLVQNKMAKEQLGFLSKPLKVKTLDMSLNRLNHLDLSDMRGLQNTESLIFKKSHITSIVMTDQKQQNLNGIRELDLRENLLSSFPDNVIQWLPNLQSLIIAHNPIHNISPDIIPAMNSLKSIDISNISLVCSCELAWFAIWRNITKTVVIGELCSTEFPVNACTSPRALTAWVESNRDMSLDIFCRAMGDPSPKIYMKRQQKSITSPIIKGTLVVSSDGEVHFRSDSTECCVYTCTAVNYMGNESLSFHVCPSKDWTVRTNTEQSQSNKSSINVWILSIILAIILLVALLTICVVYVIKRRKRSKHMTRLNRNNASHHSRDGTTTGSHVTLTRYERDDDDIWNSNELT